MENTACALCGSEKTKPVFTARDRNWRLPGEFNLVRCADCGLVYINPRPDRDEIWKYYPETFGTRDVARDETGRAVIDARLRAGLERRAAPLLDFKRAGRLLDVGCGDGLFLYFMKSLGWEVYGIEPQATNVEMARSKYGIEVYNGYIEDAGLEPGLFDAITLVHVLEHLYDPGGMARTLSRYVAPDGVIMIDVPNFAGLESRIFTERWVAVDAPRHLYHFTPRTLRELLERNGLRVLKIVHGSDVGAVKMGYSESLRHLVSDLGLRRYPAKRLSASDEGSGPAVSGGPARFAHNMEGRFFSAVGAAAELLKMGGRIVAIAEKR